MTREDMLARLIAQAATEGPNPKPQTPNPKPLAFL